MISAVYVALIALQQQPLDTAYTAAIRRFTSEPRFNTELTDHLRLSGLLVAGEELAGRPAVLDAPVGRGHVVLFAIRPFWRWSTQGSFALAFNTILNWNDLEVGWPTTLKPAKAAVAADQQDDLGP